MASRDYVAFRIPNPSAPIATHVYILLPTGQSLSERDVACTLEFFDAAGARIDYSVKGYAHSPSLCSDYAYLRNATSPQGLCTIPPFRFTAAAAWAEIKLVQWDPKSQVRVGALRVFTTRFVNSFDGTVLQEQYPANEQRVVQ